ncbi:hypothetical protein [Micrococcus sp. KRD096]|uniref:hypothetical protein n=1 Tax=Micrococcus sp. KRD096 TaxID=2729721 RepID=UPI0019D23B59|nr:hypothetical protein [Micrococcus sp. KRD096]
MKLNFQQFGRKIAKISKVVRSKKERAMVQERSIYPSRQIGFAKTRERIQISYGNTVIEPGIALTREFVF